MNRWGCIALLVSVPVGIVLRGWVLTQFWGWFIVPFGIVAISIPWAMGLASLVWLMSPAPNASPKSDEDVNAAAFKAVFVSVGGPLLSWLAGWFWAWMGGML